MNHTHEQFPASVRSSPIVEGTSFPFNISPRILAPVVGALMTFTLGACSQNGALAEGVPISESTTSAPAVAGPNTTPTPSASETFGGAEPSATVTPDIPKTANKVPDLSVGDETLFITSGNHMFYYETTLEMVKNAKTPKEAVAEFHKLDNDTKVCFLSGLLLADQYGDKANKLLEDIYEKDRTVLPPELKSNMGEIGPWKDTFDTPDGIIHNLNVDLVLAATVAQDETTPIELRRKIVYTVLSSMFVRGIKPNSTERANTGSLAGENMSIMLYEDYRLAAEKLMKNVDKNPKAPREVLPLLRLVESDQKKFIEPRLTATMTVYGENKEDNKKYPVKLMAAAAQLYRDKDDPTKKPILIIGVNQVDGDYPLTQIGQVYLAYDIDEVQTADFPEIVKNVVEDDASSSRVFSDVTVVKKFY